MEKVLVSIVVPVYNVERYLEKCVESLIKQTLNDIEIILVDDGSKDSSGLICDKLAKKDSRIKVIHKENAGLGLARNSGMELCTGEFIGFVDSDDYVDINMFKTLYDYAQKNNADYVRCENLIVDENDSIVDNSMYALKEGKYEKEDIIQKLVCPMFGKELNEGKEAHIGISVWRAIYKTKIIKDNNITFPSERKVISEDIPFNLDFLMKAEVAYVVKKQFYYYVVRKESLTKVFREDRFEKEKSLYYYLRKKLSYYGLLEQCSNRIKRFTLDRGRRCIKGILNNKNYSTIKKYNTVREILNDEIFEEIFMGLEIKKIPFKYRMVTYVMKYHLVFLLVILGKKL